jgi:hypothetical protein
LWPNTGEPYETGTNSGKGLTVNSPIPGGSGIEEYREALDHDVLPKIEAFSPQLFLVSAGFDAHRMDPLADVRLESENYGELTEWVYRQAERFSHGRLATILEGGYNLDALPECVPDGLKNLTEEIEGFCTRVDCATDVGCGQPTLVIDQLPSIPGQVRMKLPLCSHKFLGGLSRIHSIALMGSGRVSRRPESSRGWKEDSIRSRL